MCTSYEKASTTRKILLIRSCWQEEILVRHQYPPNPLDKITAALLLVR